MSFPGELTQSAAQRLDGLKESAQSRSASTRSMAQIVLAGDCFDVRDKGMGLFPCVIQDGRFFIKMSRPGNSSLPFAYCQVRNSHVIRVGPRAALADVQRVLEELGSVDGGETVSRVDLAVDFASDESMETRRRRHQFVNARARDSAAGSAGRSSCAACAGLS